MAALPEDRIVASGSVVEREKNWEKENCDICCAYVDEKTGTKCDWKQQIRRGKLLTKKENMTTQQRLDKNILRWVVPSKQLFTVVQDPDFKQIFLSLATIWQLMSSRNSDPSWKMTFRRPAARSLWSLCRSMQQPPYPRDNWSLANDGIWIPATGNWIHYPRYHWSLANNGIWKLATIHRTPRSWNWTLFPSYSPLLEPMPAIAKPCFLICTADFLQRLGSGESGKRRDSYIRYLGHVLESDKGILRSLGSGSKIVC